MNQQPDKLFREKLHGHQKDAPPAAWKRISENHATNKRFSWLKIAATILVLVSAGIFVFPILNKKTDNTIAGKVVSPAEKEESATSGKVVPEEKQPAAESGNKASASPSIKKKNSAKGIVREKKKASPAIELTKPSPDANVSVTATENEPIGDPQSIENENPTKANGPAAELAKNEGGKVTIVFSAKEVNEKYLNKNALAEATPDQKESSTLRKLMDKAYDLKHNQDPLGDLRQKKNEILALNFRSDKQRNEND
jgi:hypothetical protein